MPRLLLCSLLLPVAALGDSTPGPSGTNGNAAMPAAVAQAGVVAAVTAARPARTASPAIWSALVLATNETEPAPAPGRLAAYATELQNIFGYNQFELIGENSALMDNPFEHWLIPSRDFCVSVRARAQGGEGYPLKMTLYENRRRLADFESRLEPESPLYIRGPQYARGQLILILHMTGPASH